MIDEEDCKSEVSEAHSEQVKRFLQELLDETNTSKEKPGQEKKPEKDLQNMMALINVEQAKPKHISRVHSNLNTNATPQIQAIMTADPLKKNSIGMQGGLNA